MSRRGFTLTELLVVGALITVIGAVAMPAAYTERRELNEAHTRSYLRMIHGAQLVWHGEVGAFQRLGYLISNPPPRRVAVGANLRLSLLSSGFLPYTEDDIARRAGYRFESGYAREAGPQGCWAWPELEGYAGDEVYWMEYSSGQLYVVDYEPNWRELPALPVPDPARMTPTTE